MNIFNYSVSDLEDASKSLSDSIEELEDMREREQQICLIRHIMSVGKV